MVVARLHQLALDRSRDALASGALIPLSTRLEVWPGTKQDAFELRHLTGSPPRHLRPAGPKPNPFLPWDPRLAVEPVGDSHMVILNKYPVQIGHMLLISRGWEPQTGWLSALDWQAVHAVRQDSEGLWFFNSGPRAGASQPHRHLQLLPREPSAPLCPRQSWWETKLTSSRSPDPGLLDLRTSVVSLEGDSPDALHSAYLELCRAQNIGHPSSDVRPRQPYNLLFSDRWMGLVCRSCDESHGFSINALGFAGYLLCTDQSDRPWLDRHGPEALLRHVVPETDVRGSTDVQR